jgi:hypothetical protein
VAVPTESYMKLTAGGDDTHSDIYDSGRIKIGDTIKISGTANNNGVFFVSDVTVDSTNVYFILKGNQIVSESSNTNRNLQIEVVRASGDKLVALGGADAADNVHVWSNNATTVYTADNFTTSGWGEEAIKPTIDGNNAKYIYHFVDEALRVCNVNELNTAYIKWYGYIQRHQFAYAAADVSDDAVGYSPVFAEWQDHPNILRPPRVTGNLSYCYVNSDDVGASDGTNPTLGDDPHLFTDATNYYSEQRGVAIKKLNSGNSNSPLEVNDTGAIAANLTDTDFNFQDADNNAILDQSILGEVINIDEDLGTAPREYLFCTKTSGAAGGGITYSRAYGGALSGTAPDGYADEDGPIIERGIGFNVGVSDGTADGNWESATYEFYQSFIYDGNQESIPVKMGDGDDGTNIAVGTHTAAGGKALRVSVYADLAYSGRISGGRVYIRKQNSDDDLTLLVDIDIVKGTRTSLDGDHNNWTYETGKGYYVVANATGNSVTPNIDTYNTINGFSPDVRFVSIGSRGESYKTSVVAGRRTFIANVRTFGATGELERYGDRIMYSEINKFDTFLPHNFIDVSKGDYGEYTALQVFADRLLAFKNNLVHIINIANPSPSNWYLEDTIKYHGVNFPYSVTRTEHGVAWVNDSGCYLYDGSKVTNLVEKKLGISRSTFSNGDDHSDNTESGSPPVAWFEIARGSINTSNPMIGYDTMSNVLIIFRSPTDESLNSNMAYVYDFDSGGWVYSNNLFADSETCTNFVTDWNENLTMGINKTATASDVSFVKFINRTVSSGSYANQEFVTKDIDFGTPSVIKKIYSVTMTYKSDKELQTPLKYAVDGTQSFSSFTSNVTPQGNTGGAGYLESSSTWDVATFKPVSPISCQSIQLRFDIPGSQPLVEVNDITIEYRIIRNKMAS